jgi:hypothetical protein
VAHIAHPYYPRIPLPGSLCFTLAEAAGRTWDLLRRSWYADISLSEGAITETLLIDIQSRHPTEIVTYKFSSYEEGRASGADWEWWFGSATSWLGVRIQAKKIDPSQQYPELLHVAPNGSLQVDMLIQSSQKEQLYPLYCFYNFWLGAPMPNVTWNCGSFIPSLPALGCTIAAASAVRPLIMAKTTTLAAVAPIAYPWSCLLCCSGFAAPGDTLPTRVLALLNALPNAQRQPTDLLRPSPPDYVRALLDRATPIVSPIPDVSHIIIMSETGLRG